MADQKTQNPESQTQGDNSPASTTNQGGTDVPETKDGKKKSAGDEGDARPSERRSFFQLSVLFDALLFLVTSVYAFFAYNQWQAMNVQSEAIGRQAEIMARQLEAMNQSSAQSERLIKANEELARQNAELVAATRNMAEQNRELVAHSGEQAQASLAQADAAKQTVAAAQRSAAAAEQGVRTAAQATQAEMRPLLSVKFISLEEAVGSGANPVRATVGIENAGRTPAVKTRIYATTAFSNDPEPPPFPPPGTEPDEVVITPYVPVLIRVATAKLSDQEFEFMVKNKLRLFVWGTIRYEDISGRRYYTEFCFENLSADKTTFHGCPGHNTFK
jgi:hypothetical protein